jgi:hypothetical protein
MRYSITTTGEYRTPWAIVDAGGKRVGRAFVSFEAALREFRRRGYEY